MKKGKTSKFLSIIKKTYKSAYTKNYF